MKEKDAIEIGKILRFGVTIISLIIYLIIDDPESKFCIGFMGVGLNYIIMMYNE